MSQLKLTISKDLSIPQDFVTQRSAVLGVSGSGKSYTSAVLAEELLEHHLPVTVIDPTGAWWGLRSSADGKSAGYAVIVMGGDHGDVPLDPAAGEVVADFIIDERVQVVLDLSLMRKGEQVRFVTAFLERLYHRNREPMHLMMDEADMFAPQKPYPGTERCLGAVEDIVRRGRLKGIGTTLISQRAAVINKNVLTQIETLIVHRITSPHDRKAINEWVNEQATDEQAEKVMSSLSSLKNGQAWVWSPHWLGTLQLTMMRHRHTFNSSATPKIGERRVVPKRMADVDLNALRAKIAGTIEKAKANDPLELKARIMGLEDKLKAALQRDACNAGKVEIKKVEVPILKDAQIKRIEVAVCRADKMLDATKAAIIDMVKMIAKARHAEPNQERKETAPFRGIVRTVTVSERASSTLPVEGITPARQRILDALAWLWNIGTQDADKTQLAFLADQSPTSSAYANNLGALRSAGLIDYASGKVRLTENGQSCATAMDKIRTSADVQGLVMGKLQPARQRILKVLIERYPQPVAKGQLAELAGQSETSSAFANNLGALRSIGVLDYPERGSVVASSKLFLEAVA